jgi:hypothetical protein
MPKIVASCIAAAVFLTPENAKTTQTSYLVLLSLIMIMVITEITSLIGIHFVLNIRIAHSVYSFHAATPFTMVKFTFHLLP